MSTIHNLLLFVILLFLDAFILLICKSKLYFNICVDYFRNRKNLEHQLKNRIKKKIERINVIFGLNLFPIV